MKIVINTTDVKIRSERDRKVIILPQTSEIDVFDDKKNYVEIPMVDVPELDIKVSQKVTPKRKRTKKRGYSRRQSMKKIRSRMNEKIDLVIELILKKKLNVYQAMRKVYTHPGGHNYKRVKAELWKRGKRMVRGKAGTKGRPYKIVDMKRVKRKTR